MTLTEADIFEKIRSYLPEANGSEISAASPLTALGIDSLVVVTIILSAIEEYSLDGGRLDTTAEAPKTVGDLVVTIKGLAP
jgi:acyl carrier protein